jgi:hypothetical protein
LAKSSFYIYKWLKKTVSHLDALRMKLHQGSCSTTVSIAATTTTVSIAGIAVARSALDETLQQPAPPHTRKVAAAAVWLACRVACFPEGATDAPISPAKNGIF